MLIVNNKNITIDPKSGVPLPTSYFDPKTKENSFTLKNEFISLIVIDALSSSPEDQDYKSKLIESLITEGNWAKRGMNHNLIIPIFLNANFTDPLLIAFSGLICDSEIFIGQAVKQAMSATIWNCFWFLNENSRISYERMTNFEFTLREAAQESRSLAILNPIESNEIDKFLVIYKWTICRDYINLLCGQIRLSIMHLCQLFFQYPVTANDIWLIYIVFHDISFLANNIQDSEMKSIYLSEYLRYATNEPPVSKREYGRIKPQISFADNIDKDLLFIPSCLPSLPPFDHSSDSSSWMVNQLLDATVHINFSVFRLHLDYCDFDINSNLNTAYQWNAESCRFSMTTINLVTCTYFDMKLGKRVPLPNVLSIFLALFFRNIFSQSPFEQFQSLTIAFLKLTMNQIMYCPENFVIPLWPSAVELEGNKLIFDGLYSVFIIFQEILKRNNSVLIENYIIELIYQTVFPLLDCKMTNSSDIRPDSETSSAFVDLKLIFEGFPQPKHVASNIKDYATLSMAEILTRRWANVNTQSASTKERYLRVIHHVTKLSYLASNLSLDHRITSSLLGLQRLNKYLFNEPRKYYHAPTLTARYTDD